MTALILWLKRTFLTGGTQKRRQFYGRLFGILLATFLVQVVLGVLAGYQKHLVEAMINFSGHAIVQSATGRIQLEDKKEITHYLQSQFPEARGVFYRYHETLMPTARGFLPVVFKILSLPESDATSSSVSFWSQLEDVYPLEYKVTESDPKGALVGRAILPLLTDTKRLSFVDISQKNRLLEQLPLSGSFFSDYYDFDSRFVFITEASWQDLYPQEKNQEVTYEGFEVRFKTFQDLERIINEMGEKYSGRFFVIPFDELNANLMQALELEKRMMWLVVFLVASIASLSLFGHVFSYGVHYRQEISIMSVLGVTPRGLQFWFVTGGLISGMVMVLLGSFLAGILLLIMQKTSGIPLDAQVYFIDKVPSELNVTWFVNVILLFFGMALLSTVFAGRVVMKPHQLSQMMRQ